MILSSWKDGKSLKRKKSRFGFEELSFSLFPLIFLLRLLDTQREKFFSSPRVCWMRETTKINFPAFYFPLITFPCNCWRCSGCRVKVETRKHFHFDVESSGNAGTQCVVINSEESVECFRQRNWPLCGLPVGLNRSFSSRRKFFASRRRSNVLCFRRTHSGKNRQQWWAYSDTTSISPIQFTEVYGEGRESLGRWEEYPDKEKPHRAVPLRIAESLARSLWLGSLTPVEDSLTFLVVKYKSISHISHLKLPNAWAVECFDAVYKRISFSLPSKLRSGLCCCGKLMYLYQGNQSQLLSYSCDRRRDLLFRFSCSRFKAYRRDFPLPYSFTYPQRFWKCHNALLHSMFYWRWRQGCELFPWEGQRFT